MIIFIILAILVCLGTGIFTLLNWQTIVIVWLQPIAFIFGCLLFVFIGALIVMLIEFIIENKD